MPQFRGRDSGLLILAFILIAISLHPFPLLAIPGYELGLFLAPCAALGAAWYVIRHRRQEGPPSSVFVLLRPILLASSPPLAAVSTAFLVSASRGVICEPVRESLLCLSMACGAALWTGALAAFAAAIDIRRAGRSVFALILVWVLWDIAYLLLQPPVFIFNPLVGYFAGPIYDAHVPVDSRYLLARTIDLCVATSFIALASWRFRLAPKSAAILVSTFALGALASRPWLGIRPDRRGIEQALGSCIETPHFRIHYDARSISSEEIRELAIDHEWQLSRISAMLGTALPSRRIGSYISPDADTKKRWIGAGGTSLEDPIAHEFHINAAPSPHPVLAHELAHVLSTAIGLPGIGISFRFGLVEGLASALGDRPRGRLTLHQRAGALRVFGLLPEIETIAGATGFWSEAGPRAYAAMGSFVRWLLETKGPDRFARAYRWGDFESAYGRPLRDLIEEWDRFLVAVDLNEEDLRFAELIFQRPSILRRRCAHAVARHEHAASALVRTGRYEAAAEEWKESLRLSPGRDAPRLELGRCQRRAGAPEARNTLRQLADDESAAQAVRDSARLELARLLPSETGHLPQDKPPPGASTLWRSVLSARRFDEAEAALDRAAIAASTEGEKRRIELERDRVDWLRDATSRASDHFGHIGIKCDAQK